MPVPTYVDWSNALGAYFTQGIADGSAVYLSVDAAALNECGRRLGIPAGEAVAAFENAVRRQLVSSLRVYPDRAEPERNQAFPSYLAFLGALALAATRMREGTGVDARAYFLRLREVLGVPPGNGRPNFLDNQQEVGYWKRWNRWLVKNGFRPTARAGSGAWVNTNYAVSQAILRDADRETLARYFRNQSFPAGLDPVGVFIRLFVHRAQGGLNTHIKDLLEGNDRRNEVVEALYDAYEAWLENPDDATPTRARSQSKLQVGLYRTFDPFRGEVHYAFHPRAPRTEDPNILTATDQDGSSTDLEPDQPGWLLPFGSVTHADVERGKVFDVAGGLELNRLEMVARDFWLLVPNPTRVQDDALASWGRPRVGDYFTVLCRPNVVEQLRLLRETRLIEWAGAPDGTHRPWPGADWVEVHQCRVVAQAESWLTVSISNRRLYEELRPIERTSVSLAKGIRAPGKSSAWMAGYPPTVSVRTFDREATIRIMQVGGQEVNRQTVPRDTDAVLPHGLAPGTYEVLPNDDDHGTHFTIVDWDELRATNPGNPLGPSVGSLVAWGGLLVGDVPGRG